MNGTLCGTSCTGNTEDEFANAKTHFNPNQCPHPFHVGDLPPLIENNGYEYTCYGFLFPKLRK